MAQSTAKSPGLSRPPRPREITPSTRPHNLAHVDRDKGYRFKERDPAMIELCQMITDSELSVFTITQRVHKESNGICAISPRTVNNWLNGTTRRPQNYLMNWIGHALGYERVWRHIQ
jgi:hypothetical protein